MALFDVTIDNTKVAATYSDFPVLVDLSDMPAAFWSTVTNGGGDIRVYAADGTTELARDVVTCNTATDTGELWVKVPSLSGSADTVIKIDVDGARSDYAVGATYGRNAVWSNYWLVNHGEDLVDSAGNYGTLTEAGTVGAAAAVVGNGLSFGSGSDYCYTTSADVSAGDTFTQSFWFVGTGAELPFDEAAFGIAASANAFDNYAIHLTRALDTLIIEAFDRNTSSTFDRPISVPSVAIGDPVLIYATQTAIGSDYTAIHNGITYTGTTNRRLQDSGFNRISLNRLMDSSPITGGDMIIDEARLTKDGNARPVGWIETEYRNQTSPSTFYTVTEAAGGTEITASGAVQGQAGVSMSAEVVSAAAMIASASHSSVFSGLASAEASIPAGVEHGTTATAVAAALADMPVSAQPGASMVARADFVASITATASHDAAASAGANSAGSMSVSAEHAQAMAGQVDSASQIAAAMVVSATVSATASAEAQALASMLAGVEGGTTMATGSAIDATMSLDASAGVGMSATVEAVSEFSVNASAGSISAAGAQAQASLQVSVEAASALIAQAAAQAGIPVSHIHNITITASSIAGDLVTPANRTFRVELELRGFIVDPDNRTFTVH
jgi:hypothetical protein